MKIVILSFAWLVLTFQGYTRERTVEATVKGFSTKKAYLTKIYGYQQSLVDSAFSTKEGSFSFSVKEAGHSGMYRVVLGAVSNSEPAPSFDLILTPENLKAEGSIQLSTTIEHLADSMKIAHSEENRLYYEYLHQKQLYNKKLELLEQLLQIYPQDKFYAELQKQYNRLQKESQARTKALIKKHSSAFFARIIQLEQFPFLDARLTQEERLETLKAQLLQPGHFNDTLLLYSHALSDRILTYLSLYRMPGYSEQEQTAAFSEAVDRLMPLAKAGHPVVYRYTYQYMIEGFNRIGQDEVIAYLADQYPAPSGSCTIADEKLSRILRKAADYKKTAVGAKAPEIRLSDSTDLSGIHADYTLVLFWASWCPHCTAMLPDVKQLYKKYKREKIEVVAVSIDQDKASWARTIEQGGYNWLNFTDLKGWEGPAARAYNVHGTPAMFLLDRNKRIIAKPETIQEIYRLIDAEP